MFKARGVSVKENRTATPRDVRQGAGQGASAGAWPGRALAHTGALRTAATDLPDSTGVGVINLDGGGRIVAANDRAWDMLRRSDGVCSQGGVLHARWPADQPQFERIVAAALPTAAAASSNGSMLLRRTAMLPRFVVHVKSLSGRLPDLAAPPVAALVLIVEPTLELRIDPGHVAAILGLTRAQSHVAVWLAEGRTVHEIAVATGLKKASIHWHLQNIYRKQGISRQVDLVRLVLAVAELA